VSRHGREQLRPAYFAKVPPRFTISQNAVQAPSTWALERAVPISKAAYAVVPASAAALT